MNESANIIAMIPARIGSTRLKMKNLALINGKPLISYVINAAKESDIFARIVINSDDELFAEIAERFDVEFYLRPLELGYSTAKSDNVVHDFMLKYQADITAWVNPISPLQTGDEMREVINYFLKNDLDTLITVKNDQVHCVYEEKPVNFVRDELFAQTQDLKPVQTCVYSIMMWRNKTFLDTFERKGYALFCGRVGYFPVNRKNSVIIKTSEDLMLADYIIRAKESVENYEVQYDALVKRIEED